MKKINAILLIALSAMLSASAIVVPARVQMSPLVNAQFQKAFVRPCVLWRKDGVIIRRSMYPENALALVSNYVGENFADDTVEIGFLFLDIGKKGAFVGVYIDKEKKGRGLYFYTYECKPTDFIWQVFQKEA